MSLTSVAVVGITVLLVDSVDGEFVKTLISVDAKRTASPQVHRLQNLSGIPYWALSLGLKILEIVTFHSYQSTM